MGSYESNLIPAKSTFSQKADESIPGFPNLHPRWARVGVPQWLSSKVTMCRSRHDASKTRGQSLCACGQRDLCHGSCWKLFTRFVATSTSVEFIRVFKVWRIFLSCKIASNIVFWNCHEHILLKGFPPWLVVQVCRDRNEFAECQVNGIRALASPEQTSGSSTSTICFAASFASVYAAHAPLTISGMFVAFAKLARLAMQGQLLSRCRCIWAYGHMVHGVVKLSWWSQISVFHSFFVGHSYRLSMPWSHCSGRVGTLVPSSKENVGKQMSMGEHCRVHL